MKIQMTLSTNFYTKQMQYQQLQPGIFLLSLSLFPLTSLSGFPQHTVLSAAKGKHY